MSLLPNPSLTPATPESRRAYAQTRQTAQNYRTTVSDIGRLRHETVHLDAQLASEFLPGAIRGRRLIAEVEKAEQRTDALLQQERAQARRLMATKACLRFANREVSDPDWLAQSAQLIEAANQLLALRGLLFSWDLPLRLDQIRIPAHVAISGEMPTATTGSYTSATADKSCDWRGFDK